MIWLHPNHSYPTAFPHQTLLICLTTLQSLNQEVLIVSPFTQGNSICRKQNLNKMALQKWWCFFFLLNREDNQLFFAYLSYQLQESNSIIKRENMTASPGSKVCSQDQKSALPITKLHYGPGQVIFLSVPQIHHPQSGDNYNHLIVLWWRLLVVKITFRYSVFF